ncbi:MAG: copper resistance protein CopC [Actinomycetota bacterium]
MRRCALIAWAIVLVALVGAPSAFAHAILQESTPGNGAIVRRSPPAVTLRFNEGVETAFGSIRVYDCAGARVDSGKVTRPNDRSVAIRLDRRLPQGTYTVTWRVISSDAHPVAGAFVFSVKAADPSGSCEQVFGKGTPGEVDALFKFARALDFALILLVVGGAAALALVLRSAAMELRVRLYRLLAGLAAGLVGAALLCIILQGAVAGGFGLSEAFRWNTFDSVLHTNFGKAFLFQLAFAAVVAPVAFIAGQARNANLGALTLVPAVSLLPTFAAAGHARTSGAIAFVADVAHMAAASTWVGGLSFTVLALLLAGEDRWPLASRAVPRFSILAVASVVTLVAAGVVRGSEELVPSGTAFRHWPRTIWEGMWHTTYGNLLLAKIALVLPLLGLGAYNNRYAVPRLRKQIASVVEQRRFLRAAGAELLIMAAIVGVTAVLVTEPPAKASIKPPKFFSTIVPIGNLEANLTAEPARTGPNLIHLYFFTQAGAPASTADAKLSATLPSKNLGPLRIPLRRIVPSHYTVSGAVFPQPGDWQLTIEARRGEFESLTQTVTVPIRKG